MHKDVSNRRIPMDININIYDEVSSTNAVLKDMALKGAPAGTVVVAWKQTQGRGRLGRTFSSPEGGVYLSVLLPLDDQMLITAKAAVAVRRAIEYTTDINVGIKWVNDLIYKGKKVCGILAEVCKDKIVLGIGVNLCTPVKDFPPEIQDTAISLYRYPAVCDVDSIDVANAIVREIDLIADQPKDKWMNEYRFASVLTGQEVNIIQADRITGYGTVVSIDDNCALHVVDKNNNEMVLSTGEVSVRIRTQK